MAFNTVLLFFAQALLIQTISCQCIGPYSPFEGPYGGPSPLGAPCAAALPGPWGYNEFPRPAGFHPTNGGNFAVSSSSPFAPSGISVFSENAIEGTLTVGGVLPFLGTVGLEAELPTLGAGTVAYGCGNGAVGITAEDRDLTAGYPGCTGPGYPAPGHPGYPGYGPAPGYGYGPGCGCGIY